MNPPEARHCSGCGNELGLAPLASASETECPECRVALHALACKNGTLLDCERCGGQFVEHALLRALLLQSEVLAPTVPVLKRPKNPLDQKVVYRPCPSCRKLMHRKNFGGSSGIILDACAVHGNWFDAGELPSVLGFVEAGGLERARQAREERARRERTEQLTMPSISRGANLDVGPDLGEALLALLKYVTNVVRVWVR
jgi:Zn-finger nucleic acid-binding protein